MTTAGAGCATLMPPVRAGGAVAGAVYFYTDVHGTEMFEAIRNNKRIAQVILAILIVPFAAFGLDAYFGGSVGGGEVARINGTPIYKTEFDRILQRQADRTALKSPRFQQRLLDQLVTDRMLSLYARDMHLTVDGGQLRQEIAKVPDFEEGGQFSQSRYREWLAQRGIPAAAF